VINSDNDIISGTVWIKLLQIIVQILDEYRSLCVFEPSFGGLGATYTVYLRLIGKLIVDSYSG